MKYDPGPFMTSVLELKLDATTTFEWQKHSQTQRKVPHYQDLLDFINLRAQASESPSQHQVKKIDNSSSVTRRFPKIAHMQQATSLVLTAFHVITKRFYICPAMNHDSKIALLKEKKLCMNCLNSGHFIKNCKSIYRCKKCQGSHHTLLHLEERKNETGSASANHVSTAIPPIDADVITPAVSATAIPLKSNTLLMTCRIIITSPNGFSLEARVSLASFVSERLAQTPRTSHCLWNCWSPTQDQF